MSTATLDEVFNVDRTQKLFWLILLSQTLRLKTHFRNDDSGKETPKVRQCKSVTIKQYVLVAVSAFRYLRKENNFELEPFWSREAKG